MGRMRLVAKRDVYKSPSSKKLMEHISDDPDFRSYIKDSCCPISFKRNCEDYVYKKYGDMPGSEMLGPCPLWPEIWELYAECNLIDQCYTF